MKYLILLAFLSCSKQEPIKTAQIVESKIVTNLENKIDGSTIYKMKCTSCHNADPTKAGSIGPDIANSSYELLEAKTQRKTYPEGYTPKRKTKIMPKIPLTEEQIKAIEAFLKR
jgi:mono/diheme cytochrome c family protein